MTDYFDIGRRAANLADVAAGAWKGAQGNLRSAWYNVRCFVEYQLDEDNVLDPESSCQADVPHLLHFAGAGKSKKDQNVEASGVFEMSCPKPHLLNTGPHRAMIWVHFYKGESYVMAVEEARGIHKQNVFVGSFSPLWQAHLPNLPREYVDGIINSAVYAMKGINLNPQYHDFDITAVDPYEIIRQGCRPSPRMQPW